MSDTNTKGPLAMTVDELAQIIRAADGENKLGAGALAERILAALGGEGWQSIETAPKNRKMLVAYRNPLGNWRIVTACYHTRLPWSEDDGWDSESEFAPEAWYEESDSQDSILPTASAPTHWQPLPAPPALPTQESEDGR